jgi:hypothetical protein
MVEPIWTGGSAAANFELNDWPLKKLSAHLGQISSGVLNNPFQFPLDVRE